MAAVSVRDLGAGRMMIDLGFRDTEGLVASYLLPGEEGYTLVETGPTTCRAALGAGLSAAGVDRSEVRRVLVTHIHLDHAGGLGAAAADFPKAAVFVHERGAPHMIEPSRLAASARRAWGPASDLLWGPIEPVPADRIVPLRGGEVLPLRGGELRPIYTPGHAQHHLAFFDTGIGALLTGDAAGVRLEGSPWPRPAIPPPDLDLEALFSSLAEMVRLSPRMVLYSHFGPSTDALRELGSYREEVVAWRETALEAAQVDASVPHVAAALQRVEEARLRSAGSSPAEQPKSELVSGYDLAAQGLLRYFRTHGLLPESPS